jgi:hypothetical protein
MLQPTLKKLDWCLWLMFLNFWWAACALRLAGAALDCPWSWSILSARKLALLVATLELLPLPPMLPYRLVFGWSVGCAFSSCWGALNLARMVSILLWDLHIVICPHIFHFCNSIVCADRKIEAEWRCNELRVSAQSRGPSPWFWSAMVLNSDEQWVRVLNLWFDRRFKFIVKRNTDGIASPNTCTGCVDFVHMNWQTASFRVYMLQISSNCEKEHSKQGQISSSRYQEYGYPKSKLFRAMNICATTKDII